MKQISKMPILTLVYRTNVILVQRKALQVICAKVTSIMWARKGNCYPLKPVSILWLQGQIKLCPESEICKHWAMCFLIQSQMYIHFSISTQVQVWCHETTTVLTANLKVSHTCRLYISMIAIIKISFLQHHCLLIHIGRKSCIWNKQHIFVKGCKILWSMIVQLIATFWI